MTSKQLITHVCRLLFTHDEMRKGYEPRIGRVKEKTFANPITVLEEDSLSKYLNDNNATLDKLYLEYQKKYQQKDYHLFQVLAYLALWRLDELGFDQYRRFVLCFPAQLMLELVEFIFNQNNLETRLYGAWVTILDFEHVRCHIIDPLLNHLPLAQELSKELRSIIQKGQTIAKTKVGNLTVPKPFLLTVPKPRKHQITTSSKITAPKARPIPTHLFQESKDLLLLQKIKEQNKLNALNGHKESTQHMFNAAKIGSSKSSIIKAQLDEINRKRSAEARVKLGRPVPNFQPSPVKLTMAAILREEALLEKKRQDEAKEIAELEISLCDKQDYEMWQEREKMKALQEKQLKLEKTRITIQLLHEESHLAKLEKVRENREIAAQIAAATQDSIKAKHMQKLQEHEQKKKLVEQIQEVHVGVLQAKEKVREQKVKNAQEIEKEKARMLEAAQRKAEEEMQRKHEIIQQIRLLERQTEVNKHTKDSKLELSSGVGLLGEMSIFDLQSKLEQMQVEQKREEEAKRNAILALKQQKEKDLEMKMQKIDRERLERRAQRVSKNLPNRALSCASVNSNLSTISQTFFESDPSLQKLYEKLAQRKEARRQAKNETVVVRTDCSNVAPCDELAQAEAIFNQNL